MIWRVGRQVGRTLYRDEVLVGMVDTPELAAEIVAAMNARPSDGTSVRPYDVDDVANDFARLLTVEQLRILAGELCIRAKAKATERLCAGCHSLAPIEGGPCRRCGSHSYVEAK